ncbi:MAG: hypothetical protein HY360_15230 [Verrucomicrobia bacterium]|nr:hypothetical protein [Verrucomicrobiota bacterium]
MKSKLLRLGVIGHGLRVSWMIKNCFRVLDPSIRVAGMVNLDEPDARRRSGLSACGTHRQATTALAERFRP